jgi:hypothetical protein
VTTDDDIGGLLAVLERKGAPRVVHAPVGDAHEVDIVADDEQASFADQAGDEEAAVAFHVVVAVGASARGCGLAIPDQATSVVEAPPSGGSSP